MGKKVTILLLTALFGAGQPLLAMHEKSKSFFVAIAGGIAMYVGYQLWLRYQEPQTPEMLFAAIQEGNYQKIEDALDAGVDVNTRGADGFTPLHEACLNMYPQPKIVELLLGRGAMIDATDDTGETPLFGACTSNNYQIIKSLLEHGATVNRQNHDGEAPLHRACEHADLDVVKLLVNTYKANATVAITKIGSYNGWTPLHWARKRKDDKMIDFLTSKQSFEKTSKESN